MKLLTAFVCICSSTIIMAQSSLEERIKARSKQTLERRAEEKIDKTLNKGVDKVENKMDSVAVSGKSDKSDKKADKASGKNTETEESGEKTSSSGKTSDKPSGSGTSKALVSYSKYDFVPGEKIMVQEDFMQDAVGDFPAKWNTNSSGEIVTVEGTEGHWLKLNKEGAFLPEFINDLPENFTFEFDIIFSDNYNYYSTEFFTSFVAAQKPATEFMKWQRFPSGNEG